MSYPGSKASAGVWQRIISEMPAHDVYVEGFLGSGVIIKRKRPALVNYALDLDPAVVARYGRSVEAFIAGHDGCSCRVETIDAVQWLTLMRTTLDERALVYLDPPYLMETRTRRFYRFEFDTARHHLRLLNAAKRLDARVMISGYPSALYERELADWRVVEYMASTRGGPRVECLWCNFPAGLPLHDPRFAGSGFRERERIKRKRQRWEAKLRAMPIYERQLIRETLSQIDLVDSPEVTIAAANGSPRRRRR